MFFFSYTDTLFGTVSSAMLGLDTQDNKKRRVNSPPLFYYEK